MGAWTMTGVLVFACSLMVIYFAVLLYLKLTNGECVCGDLLKGKTVLVTGSDKGKFLPFNIYSLLVLTV